jgi:NAD(P)-dependent dehydrogenase (short-subunit alcohol dehydrogenase family)
MSALVVVERPVQALLATSALPRGAPALAGKVVAITGASAGLGRSLVDLCLAEGAFVSGLARRPVTGLAPDARFLGWQGDVRDAAEVGRWLDELGRAAGAPDALINNAATLGTDDDLDATFALNVVAPHLLIARVTRPMVARRRGWIINVTSDLARGAAPKQLGYAASKAALNSLTLSWAARLAQHGVRINALHPGWLKTELNPGGPHPPSTAWPMALTLLTCEPRVTGRCFGPDGELPWL